MANTEMTASGILSVCGGTTAATLIHVVTGPVTAWATPIAGPTLETPTSSTYWLSVKVSNALGMLWTGCLVTLLVALVVGMVILAIRLAHAAGEADAQRRSLSDWAAWSEVPPAEPSPAADLGEGPVAVPAEHARAVSERRLSQTETEAMLKSEVLSRVMDAARAGQFSVSLGEDVIGSDAWDAVAKSLEDDGYGLSSAGEHEAILSW